MPLLLYFKQPPPPSPATMTTSKLVAQTEQLNFILLFTESGTVAGAGAGFCFLKI